MKKPIKEEAFSFVNRYLVIPLGFENHSEFICFQVLLKLLTNLNPCHKINSNSSRINYEIGKMERVKKSLTLNIGPVSTLKLVHLFIAENPCGFLIRMPVTLCYV